jgi:hypothetical protein
MLFAATTLAALAALMVPALAETYNYACQVKNEQTNNNTYLYSVLINTKAGTLTWRGSVYRLGPVTRECAKYCFQATRRDGATAFLDTATQGVATLEVGSNEYDCDMVRN